MPHLRHILSTLLISLASASYADAIDDARALIADGDYSGAIETLRTAAASNPALKGNQHWNYLTGLCEYELGDYADALPYLETARAKGNREALLYLGRLSFLDYDFEKATTLYGDYRSARQKARQEPDEQLDIFESQLTNAENALQRVEDLMVIDSIAVDSSGFFKHYRLPASAGHLLLPEELPGQLGKPDTDMAFANESRDFMMWAQPDSTGTMRIVETTRLTDGSWQTPSYTPETLNGGGDADYPFMMADGTTLYFAADGDESMGGYDIFVASRDATTGEYLAPQNVGMPYNSPYDDYMLAIDELNGVGWWATDRNLLDGKVTVYVFATNDIRRNLDADDENLLSRARISAYRDSQDPADRRKADELLAAIDEIDTDAATAPEFYLPNGNGTYFHYMKELPAKAHAPMKRYMQAQKEMEALQSRLDATRRRYHDSPAPALKREAQELERQRDTLAIELRKMRSDVYAAMR